MIDLKPCPFCGDGMPYYVQPHIPGRKDWAVFCGTCGSYGGVGKDREDAGNLWNRRV